MAENVAQQLAAPLPTAVRRQNVETTQASRRFILAIDAAYADQLTVGEQSEKAFSGLLEAISSAGPIITETHQKTESLAPTLLNKGFDLKGVECSQTHDHGSIAEGQKQNRLISNKPARIG